jgi:phage baseplate assembly protein W
MRPNFGAEINAGVFENYSDAVSAIKGIVGNSFTEHLSALDLVKIETEIGTSDEIIVDIWYRLPNGQTDTTQLQANSNLYGFGA